MGNVFKRILTEVPAAVAAGVARQETNKKYAPTVAATPVPNAMLVIDTAMIVAGEIGKFFRNPVWEEATEGLALAGFSYLTEDGYRRYKNGKGTVTGGAATGTSGTSGTATQAQHAQLAPVRSTQTAPRRNVAVVEI